jgi:UDP-N-acetylglucosamine diphosphorylase/glucosamine-1-phosphate N-acetyltransferase
MRLCSFEDAGVAGLEPVALVRAAFDLRCGVATLLEKQARAVRATAAGAVVRPGLAGVTELAHPRLVVNRSDWLADGPTFLANARWLPPRKFEVPSGVEPFVATLADVVAYAWLTPAELTGCTPLGFDKCLARWRDELPNRPAVGRLARHLWDLVEWTADEIAIDFATLGDGGGRPVTLTLVGPSSGLWVHPTARIDPFVVADTTGGPVVVERDAVVTSFTRLEGPCAVGPRTQVFGASVRGGTAVGPNCRIGGELSASVLVGNVNKAHDGYLGHSYVGEWVSLGAGTHVSDRRGDHGDVAVVVNGRAIDTMRGRVGAFVGDHADIGVGCRLAAGVNAGPFARVESGSVVGGPVPAFCSIEDGRLVDCPDPRPLFDAADRVTARRGEEFTVRHRALYRGLFERGARGRRTAVYEAEVRRARR